MLPENRHSRVSVFEPRSDGGRLEVAATCAANLRMRMPMVVDKIDNAVASTYGGWPDRLYLVGRDGTIVYLGGEGPFGFKPDELEQAIDSYLAETEPVIAEAS